MEELRSTEILDREIQVDAGKKAEKILKKASIECKKIQDELPLRIESDFNERKKANEAKILQYKKNRESALPLEKLRFLIEFENLQLHDAINSYLKKIDLSGRKKILLSYAKKRSSLLENRTFLVKYFYFNEEDLKALVRELFSKDAESYIQISPENSGIDFIEDLDFHEGFILESLNSDSKQDSLRIRISLDEIIRSVQEDNLKKLTETLFCGRLPE